MTTRALRIPSLPVLLFTASLGTACGAGSQPQEGAAAAVVPQYPIEDFMATTRIGGASFSRDGQKLIFHILYSSDRGGNELTHVYVRERDGATRDLTPGDKVRATFEGWAADDRSFFVSTNERDPRFMDLYEYAADGYVRALFFRNDGGFILGPISRNKRDIALLRPRTTSDSDIHLYDAQTGNTTNITPHSGDVANAPVAFAPDSRSLLFTTHQGHEFAYLARHDIGSGMTTDVLRPAWDVMGGSFSRTGRYLTVGVNNDARTAWRG